MVYHKIKFDGCNRGFGYLVIADGDNYTADSNGNRIVEGVSYHVVEWDVLPTFLEGGANDPV